MRTGPLKAYEGLLASIPQKIFKKHRFLRRWPCTEIYVLAKRSVKSPVSRDLVISHFDDCGARSANRVDRILSRIPRKRC